MNDQIVVMEKEIAKIKGGLEENIDMWKNYELSSENLSSWLKDIEEKVRQVTGAQVNLQTFEKEMHNLKDIQNELVSHVGDFKDLTNLSETIIAECPESRIEQQVSSINNRYNTVTKHLTKHMKLKLKTVKTIKKNKQVRE